jgi:methionyl-tRNA formyltransferase
VGVIGATGKQKKKQSGYTSFSSVCEREDVSLVETADISDSKVKSLYKEVAPDVCICCGWMQIIPESILEAPTWGTVGLHLSPLPEGRGGAPVNWQLIHGHDEVTATLFRFVPEVDDGDILGQSTVAVEPRDDISTVYPKLTVASIDLLQTFLTELSEGTVTRIEQSHAEATYYPQRKPKDGIIDWSRSPSFQWNWIRAQTTPYPGAFTFYNGQQVTIWDATVPDGQKESGEPGEILHVNNGQGIDVKTGDGVIRLERLQIEGLPSMWADEAVKRSQLSVGAMLGSPKQFPDWLYTGLRDSDGGFRYDTNIPCGEATHVSAVCCSHTRSRSVQIEATLDGNPVTSTRVAVDGWVNKSIKIKPTVGVHTLRVTFSTTDEPTFDTRYLKLYVHEETE